VKKIRVFGDENHQLPPPSGRGLKNSSIDKKRPPIGSLI
jgi:hypothetical protein